VSDLSYRRSSNVLWRNVGPEVLLTRAESETTQVLSKTAADVWRLLERPRTAREIADRLGGFEGRADEIAIGVEALLMDLVWRGYSTRGDG
jgi:coenzyme PQQ synthesis protein D (PqqD)